MSPTLHIENELEGINLGDKRLDRRVMTIAGQAADAPAKSFPKMVEDASELEAVYRFFRNKSVKPAALLKPHQAATVRRCAEHRTVRVAHDTTAFFFAGKRKGMGAVSKGEGFYAHVALAIGPGEERAPLGVLAVSPFTRQKRGGTLKLAERNKKLNATPRHKKESFRWQRAAAETQALGCQASFIHVMDQEADDYALFAELIAKGERFVIRGHAWRRVGPNPNQQGSEHVQERLERVGTSVTRRVALGERKKPTLGHAARGERDATLHVRATRVQLGKNQCAQTNIASIWLNVVQVFEPNPPKGEEPVDWTLFTTEPINSRAAITEVVDHYRARWRIEEFFKALKSGCAFEERQLTDFKALVRVLAVYTPVAWRLLALRVLARLPEPPPAHALFSDEQLILLRVLADRRKRPLPSKPTVRDAMLAIAAVGGHLKRNGDPGWITLGRGYEDFLIAQAGWRAAVAHAAAASKDM